MTSNQNVHPRFLRELTVIPGTGELLLDGSFSLRVLRGVSATNLLPRLIPLLDGQRSLGDIARCLPDIPAAHLHAAVSVLRDAGAVEDYEDTSTNPELIEETLAFFRRFAGATKWNRSGLEAYRRMRQCKIWIAADPACPALSDSLRSALAATGADATVIADGLSRADTIQAFPCPSEQLIVAATAGDCDSAWYSRVDEWSRATGLPWMRACIHTGGNYADIGPAFGTNHAACYGCFEAVHGGRKCGAETRSSADVENIWLDLWAGMVALEVLYRVTRIGPLLTAAGFRRYDLRTWESADLPNARIPGCRRCLPLHGLESPSYTYTAFVYQEAGTLRTRSGIDPSATEESLRIGRVLSQQTKRFAISRQIPLPEFLPGKLQRYDRMDCLAGPDLEACPAQPDRFRAEELATLLCITAGIRETSPRGDLHRWAASAGNLGSVELYAAVRDVDGVPAGLYFYQPATHTLASLEWRMGLSVDELIAGCIGSTSSLPDALVIFTGAFHRLARKYGAFGYTLMNLDAGAALSQMRMTAECLGIHTGVVYPELGDWVERQLRLDAPGAQFTACMKLSSRPMNRHMECAAPNSSASSTFRRAPITFGEATSAHIVEQLYCESRRRVRCQQEQPFTSLRTAGIAVGQALSRRRSMRTFENSPVPLDCLMTMLAATAGRKAAGALEILVVARQVQSVPAAVYRYVAADSDLTFHCPLPDCAQSRDLVVQDEFAEAPVHLWIVGNVGAACESAGSYGHRQLLVSAGALVHRLWLAGIGEGLAGCIVAGLVPGAARDLLKADGFTRAPLTSLVVGLPAAPEEAARGKERDHGDR